MAKKKPRRPHSRVWVRMMVGYDDELMLDQGAVRSPVYVDLDSKLRTTMFESCDIRDDDDTGDDQ